MTEKKLINIIKVYSDGTTETVSPEEFNGLLAAETKKKEQNISQKMYQISEVMRRTAASVAKAKVIGLDIGVEEVRSHITTAIKGLAKELGRQTPTIIDKLGRKNGISFPEFCYYLYTVLTGKEILNYMDDSGTLINFTKEDAVRVYSYIMSNAVEADKIAFVELLEEIKEI